MRKNKKPVEEPVVVNVNKSGWEIHNGPEMTIEEMFAPFIKFVGLKRVDEFMFMQVYVQNDIKIFLYKNSINRCYLNIDEEGIFYSFIGGILIRYLEISKETAMKLFEFDMEDGRYK